MSLSRGKPLRTDRSHDWQPTSGDRPGYVGYICDRCGEEIQRRVTVPPPDWKNCPGMKRSGSLDRSKGLSPVSETNSGREHQKDEAYREWVRRQPCVACGASPPSDAAHYKSWGSGAGDWREDGTGNLISLCRPCHRLQHDKGVETFREVTGTDLAEAARRTGEAYRNAIE